MPSCFSKCGLVFTDLPIDGTLLAEAVESEDSAVDGGDCEGDHEDQLAMPVTGGWDASNELIENGTVVVYTDGACRHNQDPRFRRAGVGAFWSKGNLLNCCIALDGWSQTNQRAELEALRQVLRREDRPLTVKSDSAYVIDGYNLHRSV